MSSEDLKKTALYQEHLKLSAKMVPFAGWLMPVQYQGVIPEHSSVRNSVGIFDVSHMGEIWVTGPESLELIDYLTCNKVSSLYDGKAQYSALLNHDGGVVDDIIIYRFSEERFLICVNASNIQKDFEWIKSQNSFNCQVINESCEWGQIAVQGPKAFAVLETIFKNLPTKAFHFTEERFSSEDLIIARTGYSGEDGVEIFVKNQSVVELWQLLLKHGATACGLGARDTLRLEAAYPLYGHELKDNWLATESGLSWIFKPDKGEFIGRTALLQAQAAGLKSTNFGLILEEAGIARDGALVLSEDGAEIGVVTSGTKTPTLNLSIAMIRINIEAAVQDKLVSVLVRDKKLKAKLVKLPFYRRSK